MGTEATQLTTQRTAMAALSFDMSADLALQPVNSSSKWLHLLDNRLPFYAVLTKAKVAY